MSRLTPHRLLGGRYDVGAVIGRGGMADVYLGRDTRLDRLVAVKVLRPDLARDPQFRSTFRREAQTVAGLSHPAIVSVYDAGYDEGEGISADGECVPFIVMEYVAGRSLRDLLTDGGLAPTESVRYQAAVLSALEYSHGAGIVHRDIKPANVMTTPQGVVKVVDFGIASAVADSAATPTGTQLALGTAQYLSPEQARGVTPDARSDLYSAGCLLYELLTGRPPFVGDSPVSVVYQHVHEEPAPVSTLDANLAPAFDAVLARALAKAPRDRFQTAAAFAAALQSAAKGTSQDDDDGGCPDPWGDDIPMELAMG